MTLEIAFSLLILSISLVALAKISHVVVKTVVTISGMTRLHLMTAGFIILAVATSLPELAVSVNAIYQGEIGVTVGNVFGSNVANICLILGIAALMQPVIIAGKGWRGFEGLSAILFSTSIIPIVLLLLGELSRLIGVLLLAIFVAFVWYSIKEGVIAPEEALPMDFNKLLLNGVILVAGIVGVIVSSHYVVIYAVKTAELSGVAASAIGATVIAVGTSLPELSVDLAAIRKGHIDLALGDAMGSCLTNMTLVLGAALALSPLRISLGIFQTLIFFLLISNLFLWFFIGRGRVNFVGGLIFLVLYQVFIMTVFGVQITLIR